MFILLYLQNHYVMFILPYLINYILFSVLSFLTNQAFLTVGYISEIITRKKIEERNHIFLGFQ